MNLYLTYTSQAIAVIECNLITLNCELPIPGTEVWDTPIKAINENLWFFRKPSPEGWITSQGNHYTQEQMMLGVTQGIEQEFNKDWVEAFV